MCIVSLGLERLGNASPSFTFSRFCHSLSHSALFPFTLPVARHETSSSPSDSVSICHFRLAVGHAVRMACLPFPDDWYHRASSRIPTGHLDNSVVKWMLKAFLSLQENQVACLFLIDL